MQKILVTGGAGFVGSHLVHKLLNKGNTVLVIDDLTVGQKKHLPNTAKNLIFVKDSILQDIDKYFEGVDIVFHLAALTRPQESILDPLATTEVNINGTLRVLMAAQKHRVKRVVYASTTSIYGAQEKMPISEKALPHPMSPYALTKLAGEEYCKLFHTMYGLEFNTIRPFNIYGPRQSTKGGYAAAVPTFIRILSENNQPWITGDGTQARDYIHVEDVVDLLILMSESKVHGEAFNAGSGKNISINELYAKIAKYLKKDIKPKHIDPVYEPKETLGDISKAKKLLGWEPKVSLDDGLKQTITYTIK